MSETECAVCQDDLTDPCTVPCGNRHVFCLSCLKGIITHNNHRSHFPCPLCRKRVRIPLGGVAAFRNDRGMGAKLLSRLPRPRPRRRRSSSTLRSGDYVTVSLPVLGYHGSADHLALDIISTIYEQGEADGHQQLDGFLLLESIDVQSQEAILEEIRRERERLGALPGGQQPAWPVLEEEEEEEDEQEAYRDHEELNIGRGEEAGSGGADVEDINLHASDDGEDVDRLEPQDTEEGGSVTYPVLEPRTEELDMAVVLQLISDMEENDSHDHGACATPLEPDNTSSPTERRDEFPQAHNPSPLPPPQRQTHERRSARLDGELTTGHHRETVDVEKTASGTERQGQHGTPHRTGQAGRRKQGEQDKVPGWSQPAEQCVRPAPSPRSPPLSDWTPEQRQSPIQPLPTGKETQTSGHLRNCRLESDFTGSLETGREDTMDRHEEGVPVDHTAWTRSRREQALLPQGAFPPHNTEDGQTGDAAPIYGDTRAHWRLDTAQTFTAVGDVSRVAPCSANDGHTDRRRRHRQQDGVTPNSSSPRRVVSAPLPDDLQPQVHRSRESQATEAASPTKAKTHTLPSSRTAFTDLHAGQDTHSWVDGAYSRNLASEDEQRAGPVSVSPAVSEDAEEWARRLRRLQRRVISQTSQSRARHSAGLHGVSTEGVMAASRGRFDVMRGTNDSDDDSDSENVTVSYV